MSRKERDRLTIMIGIKRKELTRAAAGELLGISYRQAAEFLPAFNRRFQRPAASSADVHGTVPRKLDEVLSWKVQRVVQGGGTVASGGRYHLDRQHEGLSLVWRQVIVRTLRDGRMQLEYRGTKLRWRELPARPVSFFHESTTLSASPQFLPSGVF